jgi:hypothetical protein
MKIYLFSFLFILHHFFLNAQIINIDEKNGFKEFIFDSKMEKWSGQISRIGKNETLPGLIGYRYSGECCQTILDYNVRNINLFFDEKSSLLKVIIVEFTIPDYDQNGGIITDDVLQVKVNSESYFGPITSVNMDSGFLQFEWQGDKVVIDLQASGTTPDVKGFFIISSKAYLIKQNNSKF